MDRKETFNTGNNGKLWKFTTNFFVIIITTGIMLYGGIEFGYMITEPIVKLVPESGRWIFGFYFGYIGIHIFVLLYTFFTNRKIFSLYFSKLSGNTAKMLLIGIFVGFAMNGTTILAAFLHGDIHFMSAGLSFSDIVWILFGFIPMFVQSASEELLMRGYLYFYMKERHNTYIALICSGLLFAIGHIVNPGFTFISFLNMLIIGIFFSFCVYYFDFLWMAMAIHAAWNYCQNIVFGLPNSGIVSQASLIKLEAATDSIFFDSVFGIEGAVFKAITAIPKYFRPVVPRCQSGLFQRQ